MGAFEEQHQAVPHLLAFTLLCSLIWHLLDGCTKETWSVGIEFHFIDLHWP